MTQDGADELRRAPDDAELGAIARCQRIAAQLVDAWQQGANADAAAEVTRNPELGQYKSVVRDLAYEEYIQRTQRGETVDIEQFADQFANCRESLLRQLELHQLLDDCPRLTDAWFATSWPEPGGEFLGYQILECLGQGAFARVYLATEPALGNRLVAVKVSLSGLEEAGILGKLAHSHIVPIHSVKLDEPTGLSAICMPFLGRTTLCDVLDRIAAEKQVPETAQVIDQAIASAKAGRKATAQPAKPHPRAGNYVDAVMTIGMQLADALATAHRSGVYHLDLKPSNVLLTDAGRPMLLDFNLAQDQQQASARQGGTLPYMAPEQLAMFAASSTDPAHEDLARADVFSLGVVLYELLTGQLPFGFPATAVTNDQRAAAIVAAQRRGAAALRSLNPRIHESIARLVERCLAFDPQYRFATATDLAAAIRAEYGVARRALRWTGRHKRLVTATVATMLCVTILGIGVARQWRATYYLRQIAAGEEYQRQDNHAEAIKAFDRAYADHPAAREVLVQRAESRMAQGDYARAGFDLMEFLNQRDDPRALVLAAYCAQNTGNHQRAILLYRRAIDGGFDTAAVRNNLGHACERTRANAEAKANLERAIAIDPTLQAAHHNLAIVEARLAEFRNELPALAIAAIDRAVKLGPPSAELHLTAASVYAQASKRDTAYRAAAINYVRLAIEAGTPVDELSAHPAIMSLVNSVPADASRAGAAARSDATAVRLLNPLDGAARRELATGVIAGQASP